MCSANTILVIGFIHKKDKSIINVIFIDKLQTVKQEYSIIKTWTFRKEIGINNKCKEELNKN